MRFRATGFFKIFSVFLGPPWLLVVRTGSGRSSGTASAANYSRIAMNCWFDVDRPNALMSRSSAVKAARSGRLDSVRNQRARTPYPPAMFCDVASQINGAARFACDTGRSEEHTSELQSPVHL